MKIPMRVVLVVSLLIAISGPSLAQTQSKARILNVPLAWTPKEAPSLPVVDITGGLFRLQIQPFTDSRATPDTIGENTDKKPPVSIKTSSNVSQFLHSHLSRELGQLGLEIVETDADRILSSEVTQFWVTDAGSYDATVRVKLTVRDASGKELWAGLATGRGENWGRQLKVINYTEAITTAVLDLVANIVKSPEFMGVLRKAGGQ